MYETNRYMYPSFIFDEGEFYRGIAEFRDGSAKRFLPVAIGYSGNANPLPKSCLTSEFI